MRPVLMGAPLAPVVLGFDPVPGAYSDTGAHNATFTLTATQPVVWNWSSTGNVPSATVPNGGTATSITFSLSASTVEKTSHITVTVGGDTWTIDLDATGTGGSS
jgi:hypothetical protein